MKRILYFLLFIVYTAQGAATTQTSPQPVDLKLYYEYGMFDQIAKVANGCKDQKELEALRKSASIDKEIWDLILGGEKSFNPTKLSKSRIKLLAATSINTDLHLAALCGDVEFIKECLENPQKKEVFYVQTYKGYTPYGIASLRGHTKAAELLRQGIVGSAQKHSSLNAYAEPAVRDNSSSSHGAIMPAHKSISSSSSSSTKTISFIMFLGYLLVYLF